MQHARPNRLRRAVAYAALAALLGVISLTLAQCTMVGDNLTGVGLYKSLRSTCVATCNDEADADLRQAQKEQKTCVEQCEADNPPGPARDACTQACGDVLAAKIDAINLERANCKATRCRHNQGAGSAG